MSGYHDRVPGGAGEANGGTLTHDELVEALIGDTHANGHDTGAATADGQKELNGHTMGVSTP